MEIEAAIKKYFTRESIVEMLTRYNLYYQISLGNYIFETLLDINETMEKIKEMDLHLQTHIVLSNIFEMMHRYSRDEGFEERVEYLIRIRALMHSLKDFANNDKDLIFADDYIKQKSEQILDDRFFDDNMQLQFEGEFSLIYDYYDLLITDEIADEIQNNLNKSEIRAKYER